MINSVCLRASVRLSLIFRACIAVERPLNVMASRKSSATALLAVRGKRHNCAQFSFHARRCSSETGSDGTSLEGKNIQPKSDLEIQAWMSQIEQDFEKGRKPFQDFTYSQDHEQPHTAPKVDERIASKNMGRSHGTLDTEIEDFGYLEDDEEEFQEVAPKRRVPISLDST